MARKHQLREGLSAEVDPGEASTPSSWSGLAWVGKAMAEHRTLSRLVLPHDEREQIASVLDWMRSDEGPPASGDWTRISFEQALKAEHDWIEAQAKAFAKRKQDEEAGQGTTLFLDLSSLGVSWAGWRWVQVESALALDREGALMKHCVGSYAKDVAEGRKEIYSLRAPGDKPKLTVEARGLMLAQLKGCANGACPAELRAAVGAFAWALEKAADPAGLGLVELSEDVGKAGFASLPGVGVFQRESGLSMEQRSRWARWLADFAKKRKGKPKSVECEELACSLAKMGMAQELGELLPLVDPKAKHSQALGIAAKGGHQEMVAMLLSLSDPLDGGSQALRGAAGAGHKEIVEMLLPCSDPLAGDSGALRWAAKGGHKEILERLLPLSNPLARDSEALRWSAVRGYKEIVEILLPLSDPLAGDSGALRGAAGAGHKEVVEMLLPRSDPLALDSQALRVAAREGYKEIVELLLPGSDPLADDSGALRWAASRGHKEIVEMLLPESDPLADDSGALREAARAGHKAIMQILAHSYRGDEETFNSLLKKAGMNSSDFHGSTRGSGGDVQPVVDGSVRVTYGCPF